MAKNYDEAFEEFANKRDSETGGTKTEPVATVIDETTDGDESGTVVVDAGAAAAPAPATTSAPPAAEGAASVDADATKPKPSEAPKPGAIDSKLPKLEDLLEFVPAERADTYRQLMRNAQIDLQRARSDEGRVSAFQRKANESADEARRAKERADGLEAELSKLRTAAAGAKTAEQRELVDADFAELAKEFPEVSGPVMLGIKRMLSRIMPPATPAASEPEKQPREEKPKASTDETADELKSEYAALEHAHPDYRQAVNSAAFKAWLPRQPRAVQRLINSDDADDASYVLDQFKRDLQAVQQRLTATTEAANNDRLKAHVGVKGAPARVATAPDDFDAAFTYFANRRKG